MVKGNWSIFEKDYILINRYLKELVNNTHAKSALLIDKTGQLIASAGEEPKFDLMGFASLCAADFAANSRIASMVGENSFSNLAHQGENESIYLAVIEERIILAVIFDKKTTLGIVKLRTKHIVEKIKPIFVKLFNQVEYEYTENESDMVRPTNDDFLKDADAEIDKLFGD